MPNVVGELHHAEEHAIAGQVVQSIGGEVSLRAGENLAGLQAVLGREHILRSIDNLLFKEYRYINVHFKYAY